MVELKMAEVKMAKILTLASGTNFFLPKHFFDPIFFRAHSYLDPKIFVSVAQFLLNKTRPSSVYNLISTKLNGRRPKRCKEKTKKIKMEDGQKIKIEDKKVDKKISKLKTTKN